MRRQRLKDWDGQIKAGEAEQNTKAGIAETHSAALTRHTQTHSSCNAELVGTQSGAPHARHAASRPARTSRSSVRLDWPPARRGWPRKFEQQSSRTRTKPVSVGSAVEVAVAWVVVVAMECP